MQFLKVFAKEGDNGYPGDLDSQDYYDYQEDKKVKRGEKRHFFCKKRHKKWANHNVRPFFITVLLLFFICQQRFELVRVEILHEFSTDSSRDCTSLLGNNNGYGIVGFGNAYCRTVTQTEFL